MKHYLHNVFKWLNDNINGKKREKKVGINNNR